MVERYFGEFCRQDLFVFDHHSKDTRETQQPVDNSKHKKKITEYLVILVFSVSRLYFK